MCKFNVRQGMRLGGSDIYVKDSITSHNEKGISIVGELEANPTKVKFEGEVSSHRNTYDGVEMRTGLNETLEYSKVTFAGVFNTYLNGIGLVINKDMQMQDQGFTVEKGGSFSSCQNENDDIYIEGYGNAPNIHANFVDETSGGDGYTCEFLGSDPDQGNFPTCVACPACDQKTYPSVPLPPVMADE